MSFKVKTTAAGSRNVSIQISGFVKADDEDIFELANLEHRGLKVTSVVFLIQEKAGLFLWWDKDRNELILPLESRGAFRFDTGLKCPDDWDGKIWAESFKVDEDKAFLLLLDFDK